MTASEWLDAQKVEVCGSPRHDPPHDTTLLPGSYVHICPRCGRRVDFKVPRKKSEE